MITSYGLVTPGSASLLSLDNREVASLFWLSVLALFAMAIPEFRKGMPGILRLLFLSKITIGLLFWLVYLVVGLAIAEYLGIWETFLLKDTIIWALFSGFGLVMATNEALRNDGHFRDILRKAVGLVVLVEFLVNSHNFPIAGELILIPTLFILGALRVAAAAKPELEPTKKALDFILAVGLGLISIAVVSAVTSDNFFSGNTLKEFLLPPLMTILLLPFLYMLALYIAYELLFVRTNHAIDDHRFRRRIKLSAIRKCHLSLARIKRFSTHTARHLRKTSSPEEMDQILSSYSFDGDHSQLSIGPS
jgi:hypothetical protein